MPAPLAIGERAPDFTELLGADAEYYSLSSFDDKQLLVVIFSGNGCPTVKAFEDRMITLQETYAQRGVQLAAINSNNPFMSPADTYPEMVKRAKEKAFNFPYLKDEDAQVAKGYGAICTPHAFVLDEGRRLRYRGRIDNSRDPAKATDRHVADALNDLLAHEPVRVAETTPFGCSIVW